MDTSDAEDPQDRAWGGQFARLHRRRRRRGAVRMTAIVVVTGALVLLLVARLLTAQHTLLSVTQAAQTAQPGQSSGGGLLRAAQPGQPAPPFTLHSWAWWDGSPDAEARAADTITLAGLRGHPLVLNFWASWCDPCRAEAPALEAAWQQYQRHGVVFVGVDYNDTDVASAAFIKQYDVTYFTGPDATETITVAYGVPGIPTTVFIDRRGAIVSRMQGALDPEALNQAIQPLMT